MVPIQSFVLVVFVFIVVSVYRTRLRLETLLDKFSFPSWFSLGKNDGWLRQSPAAAPKVAAASAIAGVCIGFRRDHLRGTLQRLSTRCPSAVMEKMPASTRRRISTSYLQVET
ncbi:unnamed protein product [Calypogeia fissa]